MKVKKSFITTFIAVFLVGTYFFLGNEAHQFLEGNIFTKKQPDTLLGFEKKAVEYEKSADLDSIFRKQKIEENRLIKDAPFNPPEIVFPCEVNDNQYGERVFVDQTDTFIKNDHLAKDHFSYEITSAGDFNNDGVEDFLVGDERYFYLFYGQACHVKTLSDADLTFLNPEEFYYELQNGWLLNRGSFFKEATNIGDFNNDGIDDIALAAFNYPANVNQPLTGSGAVYIYFGGRDFEDPFITVDEADHTFFGENLGHLAGSTISGVGDVNGDGFDDLAVGAQGYADYTGTIYLIFGSDDWKNKESLSEANVQILRDRWQNHTHLGKEIQPAGDLNNDGIDDFLVGSLITDENVHQFAVIFGRPVWPDMIRLDDESIALFSGASLAQAIDDNHLLISHPDVDFGFRRSGQVYVMQGPFVPGTFDIDDFNITTISTVDNLTIFGHLLEVVGDLNGDNFNDFVVTGDHFDDEHNKHINQAFVFLFSDRFDDRTANDADLTISAYDESTGLFSLAALGDVNFDGFNDFALGSLDFGMLNNDNAGAVSIFLGRE